MAEIKNGYKILFIGDSITDIKFNRRMNYKIHGKNVYALQVAKNLKKQFNGLEFFYKGIASNRTYHLYDRLTKDCIELKPDVIIMLIGVNDAWEHYVPEQYPPLRRPMQPHINEIFRRIKTELDDTQVIFLLPFMIDTVEEKLPFHKILDEYCDILRKTAEENGATIIDLQDMFCKAQKQYGCVALATDGIHPTSLGHKLIAEEILKYINA